MRGTRFRVVFPARGSGVGLNLSLLRPGQHTIFPSWLDVTSFLGRGGGHEPVSRSTHGFDTFTLG